MKTIAIVEDNPDNMLLAKVLLQDAFQLHEYTTGGAAITGILHSPPDLILMDISLPDIDGIEVMRRFRASRRLSDIPMIALTAHAMKGDKEQLLAAGFDFYNAKPLLDIDVLLNAIDSFLGESVVTLIK